MNNLKNLGIFIWLILLVACASDDKHLELPPKYGMLCLSDSSTFLPTMPAGTRLYKNFIGHQAYDNYQDAIDRAWWQYEFKSSLRDTADWQKCSRFDNTKF